MEPLWAPWRMEFILSESPDECIFCTKPREEAALRANLILARGDLSFVIMNRYPYNCGHLMVVPYRHTSEFASLTADELREIDSLLQRCVAVLEAEFSTDGFNIGINLGQAGGAGIADHLHYHIVPRWVGDTNFLPVIGETKSIPEHILDTYDRLLPHFE